MMMMRLFLRSSSSCPRKLSFSFPLSQRRSLSHNLQHHPTTTTTSSPVENYAGMDGPTFCFFVENISPYMREIFQPRVTSLTKTDMQISVAYKPHLLGNPAIPALHGGVLATAIDHAAGFCAWASLDDPHQRLGTVDLRIDYLRPAPCETLHYLAKVEHKSGKLARVDVVCYNQDYSKRIAIGRGCFHIYRVQEDMAKIVQNMMKVATAGANASVPSDKQTS